MAIPRLNIDDAAVLVIDVQERLLPTIHQAERVIHNCATLVHIARVFDLPCIVTEQYPKGLGRTAGPILEAMDDAQQPIEKTRFSSCVDPVVDQLRTSDRKSVIIGGIEAHVCVVQSVLDLQESGWQCFICSDAVSAGQVDQIQPALERMRSAGAVITGMTSVMYELMRDSTHPAFKQCLELTKRLITT